MPYTTQTGDQPIPNDGIPREWAIKITHPDGTPRYLATGYRNYVRDLGSSRRFQHPADAHTAATYLRTNYELVEIPWPRGWRQPKAEPMHPDELAARQRAAARYLTPRHSLTDAKTKTRGEESREAAGHRAAAQQRP